MWYVSTSLNKSSFAFVATRPCSFCSSFGAFCFRLGVRAQCTLIELYLLSLS